MILACVNLVMGSLTDQSKTGFQERATSQTTTNMCVVFNVFKADFPLTILLLHFP